MNSFDKPSKQFLLRKLRCAYCGAEGVELTSLVMYHAINLSTSVHSLICVPCNRLIRTGGKSELKKQFPQQADALGGRGLLFEVTTRIRLNRL